MLKTIRFLIRAVFVSLVILVLGNWIHWEGRSISDQVKIGMAHAERSNWMGTVKSAARSVARKITLDPGMRQTLRPRSDDSGDETPSAEIPSSERQKLRALIQELNGSRGED